MGDFSKELQNFLQAHPLMTGDSIRKLSTEDQDALANFAMQIAEVWLADENVNAQGLAGLWLSGLVFGHNWVKEHWVLW